MKRLLMMAATVALVAGCDDDPVTPSGSITLTTTRPNPTVTAGGTAAVPIKVTRSAGFSGNVTLTVENAPTGVAATLIDNVLASDDAVAYLKLTASNIIAPQQIPITVRGTAVGAAPTTTIVTLNISANGVNITFGDNDVNVTRGQSITVPITITRTGSFTGATNFSVEGLSPGVTATVTPNPIPAGSQTATLTITASNTAPIGSYRLFLSATGTGMAESTEVMSVFVSAAN